MSDVNRCPFCRTYVDTTFNPENCPKCDASLVGVDLRTPAQGGVGETAADVELISTYIIPSVISILFCGLFGIIATVYSVLTLNAKKQLQVEKAERYSASAKWWMIAAYSLGIVLGLLRLYGKI